MNRVQSQFSLWKEIGFSVEETQDGSPTLRLLPLSQSTEERPESMHHSGGAYSESVYIYGEIINEAMRKLSPQKQPVGVLSLGLGLGYNELLVAATSIQNGIEKNFRLQSYEIVPELISSFLSFCRGEILALEVKETYQKMMTFYEKNFRLAPSEILKCLVQAWDEGRWKIDRDFSVISEKESCHVLLYDAFSGKTNQSLWTEEFLTRKLMVCSAPDALFGTYACRASLKQALKNCNYEIHIRDGFLGKRNSTQARRGVFKVVQANESTT
ncbi:MAG: MnmC family methyltransferase [Bdellovibrionota bacterium]